MTTIGMVKHGDHCAKTHVERERELIKYFLAVLSKLFSVRLFLWHFPAVTTENSVDMEIFVVTTG